MPPCAEADCDLPASWSEGYQDVLCNEHFLERFDADVEATSALLPTEAVTRGAEAAPTWTPKWIRFDAHFVQAGRKTRVWDVVASRRDEQLGVVAWPPGGRKYAFFPDAGSVYDEDCLRDIARFCEEQTRAHKFAAGRR